MKTLKLNILESPEDFKNYYYLGVRYYEDNEFELSIKTFNKGMDINSKDDMLNLRIGISYHALGNHEKAIEKRGIQLLLNSQVKEVTPKEISVIDNKFVSILL